MNIPIYGDGNKIGKATIIHGWDDPLAKPNDVIELTQEITNKEAK